MTVNIVVTLIALGVRFTAWLPLLSGGGVTIGLRPIYIRINGQDHPIVCKRHICGESSDRLEYTQTEFCLSSGYLKE